MNREEIDRIRGGRIKIIPLDVPDSNRAELRIDLGAALQAPSEVINEAIVNFYAGMDAGKIKDPDKVNATDHTPGHL